MAITPNYSWPLPDDTSLVKDGAEAIRDLGNAIDTTVDGLPGAGLVHINSTTIGSGVSAVNIDNVFSATYKRYKVFISSVKSTTSSITIRLRNAGSDLSTSVYYYQRLQANNTTLAGARTSSQSSGLIGEGSGNLAAQELVFYNPFETTTKIITSVSSHALTGVEYQTLNVTVDNSTSHDGFSVLASSGTFSSGLIVIYGLKE